MTLKSWFSWNLSVKRVHKVFCVYVCICVYIRMHMWEPVSLYKYIFILIYVSGFPSWYILKREQTDGRGTQVNSYNLLLWDLSTLCVVDHLWPLIYIYVISRKNSGSVEVFYVNLSENSDTSVNMQSAVYW